MAVNGRHPAESRASGYGPTATTVRRRFYEFMASLDDRSEDPDTLSGSREGSGEGEGRNPQGSTPSESHIEALKKAAGLLRPKYKELVPVPSSTIEIEMFARRTTWSFTPWCVDQHLRRLDLTRSGLQAVWSHLYGREPSIGARLDAYQLAARVALEKVEESVKPLAPHGLSKNVGVAVFNVAIDTACVALRWHGTDVDDPESLFPIHNAKANARYQEGGRLHIVDWPISGAALGGEGSLGSEINILLGPYRVGVAKSLEEAKSAVENLNALLATVWKAQPVTDLATMYRDLRRRLQGLWVDLVPLNVDQRARTGRCGMCG
jgi:hypothetical protein